MSWISQKWDEHKKNRADKKQKKEKEKKNAAEQQAITDLKAISGQAVQLKLESHRGQYQELLERKAQLEAQAGTSDAAKKAIADAQAALEAAQEDIAKDEQDKKQTRQGNKKTAAVGIINAQRGTPLEKLIRKTYQMDNKEQVDAATGARSIVTTRSRATASASKYTGGGNQSRGEIFKQKAGGVFTSIKEKARDAFKDWRTGLNTVYELMTDELGSLFGITGDASGLGADGQDIQDMENVMNTMTDMDNSGGGIASAASNGVAAILKCIRFIVDMVKEGKKDFGTDTNISRDHQERWKIARGYMHDIVDIFNGFKDAFGPLSKAIPFYNSILSLIGDGANMILDVMDMISASVHVDSMRKERNRIYQKIQAKKQKYSAGGRSADADAMKAYTVEDGRFNRSKKVDTKRRALMGTVASMDSSITAVAAADLRSRNDSVHRNAQYDLGERIRNKKADAGATPEEKAKVKSEKRQMEALQMMEEYREVDKAHKKMSKTLGHNIESIIKGGVSIVANGLKLAGEITGGTGVGLGIYAGGMATGMGLSGYGLARDGVAFVYSSVRKLTGTADNKATTREDMAISLINKMEEVSVSSVWKGDPVATAEFKPEADLKDPSKVDYKDLVTQSRNVEHLHNILRSGLDVTMSDLLKAGNKEDLKEKIAESFGQG